MGKSAETLGRIPSMEEFEIIDVFKGKPFDEFGISEIMKTARKRSKPWVFNALRNFERGGLIQRKVKGNMNIYYADVDNPALIGHFLFIESLKLAHSGQLQLISKIISKVPLKNYCLAIFGSWADKTQQAGSDIDLCFLVESMEAAKNIKPYLNETKLKTKTDIDEHYIKFDEFILMLLRPEENLGKQIYRNHILAFNGAIFYELIKEAHRRGFRG